MTRIESVVLDTNVLISAAISPLGNPAAALRVVIARRAMASSPALFHEFESRMARPRIQRFVGADRIPAILAAVRDATRFVTPAPMAPVCRDPADDMVLATALAARADAVVTGDEDLLVLDPFQGIRVVTPAAFLELAGA
jgi:putative PIN family toxin of toxin-antitoxin system